MISIDEVFDGGVEVASNEANESIIETLNDGLLLGKDKVNIESSCGSKDKHRCEWIEGLGDFIFQKGVNILQYREVINNFNKPHHS